MKIQFSIRDLLWLTLVVALIAGCWMDRHSRWDIYAIEQGLEHRYEQRIQDLEKKAADLKTDNDKLLRALERAYSKEQ